MYAFTGTVVGLRFKDGIVLASDTRATAYYLVLSKRLKKIFELEERIGAGFTGSPGDVQSLVGILRAEARLYRVTQGKPIQTKSLTQVASNYLAGRRIFPMLVDGMIGGVDPDGPHLFFLDAIGGKIEETKFASSGTGATVAYGVLEQSYKEGMKQEEAIKLAGLAIKTAIERDAATGDGVAVAVIDERGYRELLEESVGSSK
jgi:proteasome beta subunit